MDLHLYCFFSARAELDGNRPRSHNPRTLIQIKNPERNHDPSSITSNARPLFVFTAKMSDRQKRLFLGFCSVLLVGSVLLLVSVNGRMTTTECDGNNNACGGGVPQISALAEMPSALSTNQQLQQQDSLLKRSSSSLGSNLPLDWARVFNKIGKQEEDKATDVNRPLISVLLLLRFRLL